MTTGNEQKAAQLIDAEDVAGLFKCKYRTVQKLVAEGVIPVVKIPGSRLLRFRASAIADVLAKLEMFRSPCPPFDDGPGSAGAMAGQESFSATFAGSCASFERSFVNRKPPTGAVPVLAGATGGGR